MNYATIKETDIANGTGVRVSIFVSGCTHHCKECFNPEAWDFNYGEPYTEEVEKKILDACNHSYINGLSLLGGEPMHPANVETVAKLAKRFKELYPDKTIWCYSGYTLEELVQRQDSSGYNNSTTQLLHLLDVLVDGKFEIEKKDLSLKFRGSSNQRVIDMNKTNATGKVVLMEQYK